MPEKKIITLTMNPAVDKSTQVQHVAPDQKLRCEKPRFDPGGGGINVARVITRLGGRTEAIYPRGGPMGDMLYGLLESEQIQQHTIPVAEQTRTNLTVYDQSSEQQFRFGMPGTHLTEAEWQRCLEAVEAMSPDFLVASGSLPPGVPDDFYARVAHIAHKVQARYALDTSGDALTQGVEGGCYLLKPNMRELQHLAGESIDREDAQEQAARSLIEAGKAEIVVVSLGSAGALLVTADGSKRLRAPSVTIRSKVGAGDSMMGGMVLALARQWPVEAVVNYGIAAGAAAVTSPGTKLCEPEDVEALYQAIT